MSQINIPLSQFITLPSARVLLITNVITIFLAINQGWNFATLIWIYFIQSVIIGLFQFLKIWTAKKYTFDGMKMEVNGKSITEDPGQYANRGAALFFLIHYGGFHAAYLLWLLQDVTKADHQILLYMGGLFFLNHLFSFITNYFETQHIEKNIGNLMFFPYARIFPMHLFIVFGFGIGGGMFSMIFFLTLKTFADLFMHVLEHNQKQKTT